MKGIIDFHTHIGRVGKEPTVTLDAADLVRKMDRHGIEMSVVLPLHDSPCGWYLSCTTEDVIRETNRFPGRLIPFCQIDPRFGNNSARTDFSSLLEEYKARGCRGVGEMIANLYYDDPMVINLVVQCGRAGLPVVFHGASRIGGTYGLADDIGLPRLERLLQAAPETVLCGHGPAFWSEISSNVDEKTRGGYPKDPVAGPGRIPALMAQYPNLYGDLSAHSAYNAITRSPDFGLEFLDRFQDRLLFATDTMRHSMQDMPMLDMLKRGLAEGRIKEVVFDKITRANAAALLRLRTGRARGGKAGGAKRRKA